MRWGCGSLQTASNRNIFSGAILSERTRYRTLSVAATRTRKTYFSAGKRAFTRPLTACTAQAPALTDASNVSTSQNNTELSNRDNERPLVVRQGLSEAQLQRNNVLTSKLQGKLILAPLTKYAPYCKLQQQLIRAHLEIRVAATALLRYVSW